MSSTHPEEECLRTTSKETTGTLSNGATNNNDQDHSRPNNANEGTSLLIKNTDDRHRNETAVAIQSSSSNDNSNNLLFYDTFNLQRSPAPYYYSLQDRNQLSNTRTGKRKQCVRRLIIAGIAILFLLAMSWPSTSTNSQNKKNLSQNERRERGPGIASTSGSRSSGSTSSRSTNSLHVRRNENEDDKDDGDVNAIHDILPGSDRDKHGCIPSAGYVWCKELHECVRPWEVQPDLNTTCPSLVIQDDKDDEGSN